MGKDISQLQPEEYFQEFLTNVRTGSIRNLDLADTDFGRGQIDWSNYEELAWNAFHDINPQSIEDMPPIINSAIELLEDGHSHYIGDPATNEARFLENFAKNGHPMPSGQLIGDLAYIDVPGCNMQDPDDQKKFATELQNIIQSLDESNPKGWVIDLRNNFGGNSYVMLAGLGPILGEGINSQFYTADKSMIPCWYEDGVAGVGTDKRFPVCTVNHPYLIQNPGSPIATLIGNGTCSAGEQAAIALSSLSKLYGEETWGNTTGNATVPIVKGDTRVVAIASSIMADRTGKLFGRKISPDIEFPAPEIHESPADDPLVKFVAQELKDEPPRKITIESAEDLDSFGRGNLSFQ